jgi:hypothetical protein
MWRALDAASVRMTKSLCSAALCWPFLAYELDNLRNQFGGHNHDGLPLGQKSRFVFGNLLVFGSLPAGNSPNDQEGFLPRCDRVG